MPGVRHDLREWFDGAAHFYMGLWEFDPDTRIVNNTITGRNPARETHESRMIELFWHLRDTVDAVPDDLITQLEAAKLQIGPERYEQIISAVFKKIPGTAPGSATEVAESFSRALQH